MKKTILLLTLIFVLFASLTAFAEDSNQVNNKGFDINRSVTLEVEEKDPRLAYNASITPIFGPMSAANYLAYSPINWKAENSYLQKKATMQTLWNVAAIAGGIALDISNENDDTDSTYNDSYYEEEDNSSFGTYTLIGVSVAVIHNHFFGERMAQEAVDYNKRLYARFKWTEPKFEVKF